MRSTHTCTPSFATFLHQYSRRLLSILAQPIPHNSLHWQVVYAALVVNYCVEHVNTQYVKQLAQLCNQKRKKCGAHMHAHHLSRLFFLNIHVGCCLFSHNPPSNKTKSPQVVWQCSATGVFVRRKYNVINELNKRAQRKKMRSTHACTPSFATFSTQYSRRLLSILAHPSE